jgi:gliding motility-associated-like protein
MNRSLSAIFLVLLSLFYNNASASHIVGGEVTYRHITDSFSTTYPFIWHKYQVSVTIYEDCKNGQPEAIAEDNPAYIGVYQANFSTGFPFVRADSIFYSSSVSVPANFTNACVSNIPEVCLLKKTFVINYALPANSSGYIIEYQRCCRNGAVMNIQDPADNGSTYFCYIPPHPIVNNSAIFKNYPPQIICLNNPLFYDHSATDADGDSLSYGFTSGLYGATNTNIKPFPPYPPPFDTVRYTSGFSSQHPVPGFPPIQIDPVTGLITGTPNRIGRYLVTVYCNEYREGILINTVTREFQFVVTDCSKVVVADIPQYSTDPNTYIVNCEDYTVHFVNTSAGGFSYHWDFGVNGATSTEFQPTFTYPDTGTFSVKLIVNPGSTCPDSITRLVKVYPKFHAAFIDSGGKCPGAPVSFIDQSSATIKPVNFWKWSFGDGDSSFLQNPVHTYLFGGAYNVILISHNIKNCADTSVKHIFIDNFYPFAGNDTIIVKGESIQFHAYGGTQYLWSPPDYLNDTTVYNPVGTFTNNGIFSYSVHIVSPYGCAGYDTINVTVVNQAAFQVPNAFTPNGDGINDIFRPYAIGFRNLNYFRVFNRWGEEVYFSTNLETGWDGTYRKKQCDMGTYFWEISYTDRFGDQGFMKGDVELVK